MSETVVPGKLLCTENGRKGLLKKRSHLWKDITIGGLGRDGVATEVLNFYPICGELAMLSAHLFHIGVCFSSITTSGGLQMDRYSAHLSFMYDGLPPSSKISASASSFAFIS